jgi:LacI family transcriptional regulator
MADKKATISDVARLANVAQGTVTRYFNNENIKEKNKENIEKAIDQLNYKINYIARSLRSNKTYTVGVLVTVLSEFTGSIISGIEDYLSEYEYSVITSSIHMNLNQERKKLQYFLDKNVDGLIVIPSENMKNNIDILNQFRNNGVPIISIDNYIEGFECDTVMVDNVESVYNAVRILIINGHNKIGLIYGGDEYSTSIERFEGYKKAINESNLEFDKKYIFSGQYVLKTGYEGMRHMMSLNEKPTAIIGVNYDLTMGMLTYINHHNIRIPEDVAVFGYDADVVCNIFKPNISVVTQPLGEIGTAAASLLIKRLQKENLQYEHIRFKTKQHVTKSVEKTSDK